MAIAIAAPAHDAAPIKDPVTFDEAAAIFRETGLPEFTRPRLRALVDKLQRWAKEDGLTMERRGKAWVASYTDLLEAHARRYPAPRPPGR